MRIRIKKRPKGYYHSRLIKRLERKKEKYWCPACKSVVKRWTYFFVHVPTGAIIRYHNSAS